MFPTWTASKPQFFLAEDSPHSYGQIPQPFARCYAVAQYDLADALQTEGSQLHGCGPFPPHPEGAGRKCGRQCIYLVVFSPFLLISSDSVSISCPTSLPFALAPNIGGQPGSTSPGCSPLQTPLSSYLQASSLPT